MRLFQLASRQSGVVSKSAAARETGCAPPPRVGRDSGQTNALPAASVRCIAPVAVTRHCHAGLHKVATHGPQLPCRAIAMLAPFRAESLRTSRSEESSTTALTACGQTNAPAVCCAAAGLSVRRGSQSRRVRSRRRERGRGAAISAQPSAPSSIAALEPFGSGGRRCKFVFDCGSAPCVARQTSPRAATSTLFSLPRRFETPPGTRFGALAVYDEQTLLHTAAPFARRVAASVCSPKPAALTQRHCLQRERTLPASSRSPP